MRYYVHKIGQHLQELAVLALVFVPLDRQLMSRQLVALGATFSVTLLVEIELERRTR